MNNIYAPKGTKVIFTGQDETQQKWGSHDSSNGVLVEGQTYTIERTEVHTMHTKVYLQEAPGKKFNSVCFEEV